MKFNSLGASPNNFNLIRLTLAILVVLSHSYEIKYGERMHEPLTAWGGAISFGDLAVQGFFLLSGYLILKSWLDRPHWVGFAWRRLLRIGPGYWVAYVLSTLLALAIMSDSASSSWDWWRVLSGMALFGQPSVPPVFEGTSYPGVNVPLWSIQYEMACYAGVLLCGVLAAKRVRTVWMFALCMFAVLMAIGHVGALSLGVESTHYASKSIVRLPFYFLVGGLYAFFGKQFKAKPAFIAVALVGFFATLGSPEWVHFGMALFGGYILFSLACLQMGLLGGLSRLPDVSYGLYLYAWPVSKILFHYFPDSSAAINFLLTAAFSAFLGWMSWKLVEEPALRWKSKF